MNLVMGNAHEGYRNWQQHSGQGKLGHSEEYGGNDQGTVSHPGLGSQPGVDSGL